MITTSRHALLAYQPSLSTIIRPLVTLVNQIHAVPLAPADSELKLKYLEQAFSQEVRTLNFNESEQNDIIDLTHLWLADSLNHSPLAQDWHCPFESHNDFINILNKYQENPIANKEIIALALLYLANGYSGNMRHSTTGFESLYALKLKLTQLIAPKTISCKTHFCETEMPTKTNHYPLIITATFLITLAMLCLKI